MTKILIIEDDPIIANIYRSRLDKEGFQVELASDGQTGFYCIHETHPDAILLDLMLPKMDGMQILRKLRAQKQFQKTPVIVFTNAYVPDMIEEASKAGATFVFNKSSLTPKQLVEAFHQALFPASGPKHPMAPVELPPSQTTPWSGAIAPNPPAPPPAFPPPAPNPFAPPPELADESTSEPESLSMWGSHESHFQSPPPPELKPSAPAPADNVPNITSATDASFQNELLDTFKQTVPEILAGVRKLLHEFLKTPDETNRLTQLFELYRKVHAVTGNSAIVGLYNVAQTCAALEALIKELKEKPKNINPSSMRTITHTIDFLGVLLDKDPGPSLLESSPPSILVVDDELISRRAVVYALEKARLKSESLDNPLDAFQLLTKKSFDLVILDVDMPGMNGFELCAKLRNLPTNLHTPVIFVTSLTDFESRARSSLSGGNDLIAKPFLFIELTVKSLVYVLRRRVSQLS